MVKPWAFLIFLLANGGDGAWVSTPPRQNYGYSSYKNNYQSTSLNSITSQLKDLNWKVSKYKEQLYKAEDEIDSLWVSEVGQDYKIQSLEGKDKQHDGRLYSLEVNSARQDEEIDSLETKTAVNSGRISDNDDDILDLQDAVIPVQCDPVNYKVLNSVRRHVGSDRVVSPADVLCDTTVMDVTGYNGNTNAITMEWYGNAWYRFMGDAGTQMPVTAPAWKKCGTTQPGWLATPHPTIQYETIPATYCFRAEDVADSCKRHTEGLVTKCNDSNGDFYVYYLVDVSTKFPSRNRCHLAYCGTYPDS